MQETQSLVTIIPWTFIAQILNLFIQMYLIKGNQGRGGCEVRGGRLETAV